MKNKIEYGALCFAAVLIVVAVFLEVLPTASPPYTYDDIPRRYVIGEITSISPQDGSLELLLEDGKPASVTMTDQGAVAVYAIADAKVVAVDFAELKTGQTVQCDIRLSVTLEKINSFHDCRQIFILSDEGLA